MRKILLLLAVAFLPALAHAATPPSYNDPNGIIPSKFAENTSFVGDTEYRMGSSTPTETAVLLYSGASVVYDIDCSSGTLGAMLRLFDTATVTQPTFDSDRISLGPTVVSAGMLDTTKTSLPAGLGRWTPGTPRNATTGVVAIKRIANSPDGTTPIGKNSSCSIGIRAQP